MIRKGHLLKYMGTHEKRTGEERKAEPVFFAEQPITVHRASAQVAADVFATLTGQQISRFRNAPDFANQVRRLPVEARNALSDYLARNLHLAKDERQTQGGHSAAANDQILLLENQIKMIHEADTDANRM